MKIKLFLLLFCIPLLVGCGKNVVVMKDKLPIQSQQEVAVSKDEPPVEFQITKEEMAATVKWKNRSLADLSFDALKGDKGGLYTLGNSFFMGWWGAIDTKSANFFYSKSASFGFAPALDAVRLMYLYENKNAFLSMVYLNLIISEGHTEFLSLYYELQCKTSATEGLGPKITQEVERIAMRKRLLILRNNDAFQKCSDANKNNFVKYHLENITDEDLVYDSNYLVKVLHGARPSDKEVYHLMIYRKVQKARDDLK